jgi:hypothetical protein
VGYASQPNPAFGYFRGIAEGPFDKGQGSMMGLKEQGKGFFSQGQGPPGASGWDPTIVYLFILVVAEMFVFGVISRMLR